MKKKLLSLLLGIIILQSCNNSPKCGDKKVTENSLAEFKLQIREQLLKEYENEHINTNDIYDYAQENNYTYQSVLNNEMEKIKDSAEIYVSKQLETTQFKNIITKSVDEKIKKCDCEAEVENKNLVDGLIVVYSAQKTEDGNLKIILDYIAPH